MAERILVRSPNWIGDAVLSLGFLAALKKKEPEAGISILANALVADLFRGHPVVEGILEFEKNESLLSVASRVRRFEFDSCYLLPLSLSSAIIACLAGIPQRIGYDAEFRGILLTTRLRYDKGLFRSRHLLDGYCRMLGGDAGPEQPKVHLTAAETAWAEVWLADRGLSSPVIGLGPGATYGPAKRWPREKWIELGQALAKRGDRILIFGSAAEASLCQEISGGIGRSALSCAGGTGLRQSAALLSKCQLFITNDTGVMHLAAAVGATVVAIFGSTNPDWTRPWGQGHAVVYQKEICSPCYRRTCRFGHYNCMERISTGTVLKAIDKIGRIR